MLGEPVVSLGAQALIADGGLVVQDAIIVAAGRRAEMEAIGPFAPELVRERFAEAVAERVYRPPAQVRR